MTNQSSKRRTGVGLLVLTLALFTLWEFGSMYAQTDTHSKKVQTQIQLPTASPMIDAARRQRIGARLTPRCLKYRKVVQ